MSKTKTNTNSALKKAAKLGGTAGYIIALIGGFLRNKTWEKVVCIILGIAIAAGYGYMIYQSGVLIGGGG